MYWLLLANHSRFSSNVPRAIHIKPNSIRFDAGCAHASCFQFRFFAHLPYHATGPRPMSLCRSNNSAEVTTAKEADELLDCSLCFFSTTRTIQVRRRFFASVRSNSGHTRLMCIFSGEFSDLVCDPSLVLFRFVLKKKNTTTIGACSCQSGRSAG